MSPALTIGLSFSVTGIFSDSPAFTIAVAVFSICNSGLKIPMSAVIAGIAIVVHDSFKSSETLIVLPSYSIVPVVVSPVEGLVPGLVVVPGVVDVVFPGVIGSTGVIIPVVLSPATLLPFSLGLTVFWS